MGVEPISTPSTYSSAVGSESISRYPSAPIAALGAGRSARVGVVRRGGTAGLVSWVRGGGVTVVSGMSLEKAVAVDCGVALVVSPIWAIVAVSTGPGGAARLRPRNPKKAARL